MDKATQTWVQAKIERNLGLYGEYAEKSRLAADGEDSPITLTYGHLARKYLDEAAADILWLIDQQ